MITQSKYDLISGFLLLTVLSGICFAVCFTQEKKIEQETIINNDSVTPVKNLKTYTVTCTTYNPTPAQGWGNGLITFDGNTIDTDKLERHAIRWCAVSHDLAHLMGKTIIIQELGTYEVHDLMHKRHRKRIDLLIHPKHKHFKKDNLTIVEP